MAALVTFHKGWVQRAASHLYQEGELKDALNVIPDAQGAITTRLGHAFLNTTTASDVHSLYTSYSGDGTLVRYQGAGGQLYRNFLSILGGLDGSRLSFVSMRGFGEQKVYTFFAGGQDALRVKDDGTTLTRWGLAAPVSPVTGTTTSGAGDLQGRYVWKQAFVRKPLIPNRYGRWTAATGTYSLGASGPITLSTGVSGDGIVVAGTGYYNEIVLAITGAASAGTYDYSYWNGTVWVPLLPQELPVYTTTGITRVTWESPSGTWTATGGEYLIRIRATTAPGTAAVINTFRLYDPVWSAVSNGSPDMVAFVNVSSPGAALITLSNALLPGTADFDPQVSHSAIFRTRGDDPALANTGAGIPYALYYFEADVPVEQTTYRSFLHDDALGAQFLDTDNNRPPAFTTIADHQNRLWGALGNRLLYSKEGMPESYPGENFLDISVPGDDIRRIKQYDGILYVWTFARVYQVIGTDETSYTDRQIQSPVGLGGFNTVDQGARGILFLGSDGNLWLIQGTTVAVNISQDDHYQFFHSLPLNGVAPLNQATRDTCVGVWAYGRYYLSYPASGLTLPSLSLFVDESDGTWWRDARPWRAMYYDRRANTLYGSNTGGGIFLLETGVTDNGTPFQWNVQTRDDDEQAPTSDKELVQATIEANTGGAVLTVAVVRDYGSSSALVLGTVTTSVHQQVILPTTMPGAIVAKALGYSLTGLSPMLLTRILPQVRTAPPATATWLTLPTTLGYAGPKLLESLLLDVDLQSGTLACDVYADNALAETFTLSTLGRRVSQVVRQPHEASTFRFLLRGTGHYTLYDASTLGWRPLPPPQYCDTMVYSDLGSGQQKIGLAYGLDVELLGAGTLTTAFDVDGAEVHHLDFTSQGRQRTDRFRLPAAMRGRLFQVRRQSTVPYRLWGGTELAYQVVGSAQEQTFRAVTEPYGQLQRTPLLSLVPQGS